MELLLLFLDKKKTSKLLRSYQKQIVEKKKGFLENMQLCSEFKLCSEKAVFEENSYYMKLSKCVNKMINCILHNMKTSPDLFPQIVVTKKIIDIINTINQLQTSQEKHVRSLFHCMKNSTGGHDEPRGGDTNTYRKRRGGKKSRIIPCDEEHFGENVHLDSFL